MRRAVDTYLRLDARSLGLFRIGLALLLGYDLARRVSGIALWYTDDGLVAHAGAPLSLFHLCGTPATVAVGFALAGVVYLLLLVGYRTRVAQVLTLVAVLSLHNRCPVIERSGEKVLDLLALWTVFLPLGGRFSLDARRGFADEPPPPSLAVLALLLQFAAIYFLSGIQKTGVTWQSGTAIHYLLERSDVVTALGLAVRDGLPSSVGRFLSFATVAIEIALPILLLTPVATVAARRLAIVLMVGLNAGIALAVNLGIYQPTMVCFCALLLSPRDWERIGRFGPARWIRDRAVAWAPALRRAPPSAPPLRVVVAVREAVIAVLIVAAAASALNQNDGVAALKHAPVPGLEAAMERLGLPQAWSRFAPDVPTTFRMLAVDALTSDGRHVDPLAFAARGDDGPPREQVPDRLGYDTFWHNYERIVGTPLMEVHGPSLVAWLFRHHERTRRAEDRVVSFTLYGLIRTSPPPGSRAATTQKFVITRRSAP